MARLTLSLEDMTLATDLKQTVSVKRGGKSFDDEVTDVAIGIEMVILPNPQRQIILETGQVITAPAYIGRPIVVNTAIRVGDFIERSGQPRLFVESAPPPIGKIQRLELREERL